VYIYVI